MGLPAGCCLKWAFWQKLSRAGQVSLTWRQTISHILFFDVIHDDHLASSDVGIDRKEELRRGR